MHSQRRLSHETSDSWLAFKTPRFRNHSRWRVSGSCGTGVVSAAFTETFRGVSIGRFGAGGLPGSVFFQPAVLHGESPVEAPLVSSRLWLRCRSAQPRSGG